jgi:hypothetical protein
MDRPVTRYRFTFTHTMHPPVTLEAEGGTRCLAKGFAWQLLEAQLRAEDFPRDQWWTLTEQTPVSEI